MTIAGTFGWTIEAPAATAQAVLPVGVEMISPIKKKSLCDLDYLFMTLNLTNFCFTDYIYTCTSTSNKYFLKSRIIPVAAIENTIK